MLDTVLTKIIVAVIGLVVSGLGTYFGIQVKKYKKLVKKDHDEKVQKTIKDVLNTELQPVCKDINTLKQDISGIQEDISNLQTVDTNFTTRLAPVQEEIEAMKDDITDILSAMKKQDKRVTNIEDKEDNLEEQTRCAWRYRIRFLCHAYIKRGYMTDEEYAQLQEMMNIYTSLGGNGQTKELYDKAMQLEIRSEK